MKSFGLSSTALVYGFAVLVLIFLVLPVLIVIPMSVSDTNYLTFPPKGFTWRWYVEIFTSKTWTRPAGFSVRIASLSAIFSTVLGSMAAYALVRGTFSGKGFVRLLIVSPIIAPNIVIAVGVYFAFNRWGLIGHPVGFVFAHSLLCIPFVVLSVTAALERFDTDLELAAMNLGASRFVTFRRVTLPIIAPGVVAGGIFSFIISFDEAVISYFISSVRQSTLPRVMFQNIETQVRPDIAAISTVLIALSSTIVCGILIYRSRKGWDLFKN